MKAKQKLIWIRWKLFSAIKIALITSLRSSLTRTMPAAPTVMSEAELIAQPTSAYAKTGLSLMPSPTNMTSSPSDWYFITTSFLVSGYA